MQLVVNQTEQEIEQNKRMEMSAYFDCKYCGKRAYTTLRAIQNHVENCPKTSH